MNTDDEKISSLYHEAGTPAPSKSLDDAILAAARDAVDKPASTRGPFSGSWPAAATIAAVIVITIILVPVLVQQEPQPTLTQTSREISSPHGLSDETGPNAYMPAVVKKKSMDTPSPAGAPAIPEQNGFSEYRSMPSRSDAGSSAATSPAVGAVPALENQKMQAESDTSDMERSRMQAADSAPFAILTPEMWQVKISRLIAEGKTDDAQAEIEKLEKHYPEHIIDPALLEQLR